jgi:hypothetical protein
VSEEGDRSTWWTVTAVEVLDDETCGRATPCRPSPTLEGGSGLTDEHVGVHRRNDQRFGWSRRRGRTTLVVLL